MNSKQAKITSRNCKQQLQARSEFKTRQIMKLPNQKVKVTFFYFFLFFFDRNQPMTQPSAGKNDSDIEWKPKVDVSDESLEYMESILRTILFQSNCGITPNVIVVFYIVLLWHDTNASRIFVFIFRLNLRLL